MEQGELVVPGSDVDTAGVWPGVADPAGLLTAVADWLAGYGNTATRHTYAGQALGLPVSVADIERWAGASGEQVWARAVRRYTGVMRKPGVVARSGATPPPGAPGRLRHLHWFRWCASRGLDPVAARASHVKVWVGDLVEAGAAGSTCDKMLGAVRAFYDHLVVEDVVEVNPAALNRKRLGLTSVGVSRTVVLADAEVAALFHFAGRLPRQRESDRLRARAVVALFTAGVRVSELCGLDRADLHRNRGHRALRVAGKGGKDRIVYLAEPVAVVLDEYLAAADRAGGVVPAVRGRVAAGTTPLLVNRNGRRCTRQAVWELLRRIAAAVDPDGTGLAATLHPHALRHYYVTTAVAEGADFTDIAVDVGHASTDTTRHVYNAAAPDPARSSAAKVAARVFGGA
ncbi:tyrosine-type recombinase/integrase [Actinokineospora pegani]|uniref:tyrosine-type recombinase/integrase n=1 Tax=Actinokineospora pegani TaxID=2654637 RepID=UPI0012EAEF61|nr:tyrosine-type recombinase/integrase [Actinokineospora pegani]